ncbi:SDR family oxidoreductase [Kutzneria sp. CA-103260]|uniref:SDR family oxidoreductase n=1 Tax=Kutzneria sp. CA-103260 TaxID=2802641 RepID=UPI001BA5C520|nr:SDR family oxidoreductase [Kutzneria sp. CA-103260]QUQ67439.1 SDR family oxidoreductase [Kutzneria sp. CA-103260]
MKSSTVTSDGVRLAVYEQGDRSKPTVLLVHGYPDTHLMWSDVAARLAEDFHVVSYDTRGSGKTTKPSTLDGYRLEHLANDLMAVADAVSPNAPVHVLAHDWGSIQAWEAVTEPANADRIASYTSISGPCLDHIAHWTRRPSPKTVWQMLHSWYIGFFHLPVLPTLVWRFWLGRNWGRLLSVVDGVPRRPGHPAPTITKDGINGMSLYKANFRPVMRNPRERRTTVPVQVIHPERDRYVTAPLTQNLQKWAPKLWRRTIPASHWVAQSHPDVVARMATEFIRHVDGEPATRSLRRAEEGRHRAPFADQLVVVTGGGSGIGRATALAFAKQGAEVVVCDVNHDTAAETAALAGVKAHAYQVNVADEGAVAKFAADVAAAHGIPDVVVNNAGIGHAGALMDATTEEWQRVLDVNLWGVIHGCKSFGELMIAGGEGGHIVNVASAAAYLPTKLLGVYSTSKAAVFMLSDCLRAELAAAGVGVSTICPGIVNTNIAGTTTFSGVSAAEQTRRQEASTRAYRRRNFPPEKVAAEIVRAVRQRRAVVPVTIESKVARVTSRLFPSVLRGLAARF